MQALKEWCFEVQEHRYFNRFFLALIYLNTVLMAMEHHGMSSQLEFALLVTNFVFTFFFTVEIAIKITGIGFWDFWMDNFNRFDFCIVGLSVIEVLAIGGSAIPALRSLKGLRSLKVLKTFRVFRIFKMFRYLSSLRIIGEVILSSLGSFISIAVLLFLFLLVFAIVGLHVFGGLKDPNSFRYGVDDLSSAAARPSIHSTTACYSRSRCSLWRTGSSSCSSLLSTLGGAHPCTLSCGSSWVNTHSSPCFWPSPWRRSRASTIQKRAGRRGWWPNCCERSANDETSDRRRRSGGGRKRKKRKELAEERQQDKDGTCDALGDEDNEVASTAVVTLSSPRDPSP